MALHGPFELTSKVREAVQLVCTSKGARVEHACSDGMFRGLRNTDIDDFCVICPQNTQSPIQHIRNLGEDDYVASFNTAMAANFHPSVPRGIKTLIFMVKEHPMDEEKQIGILRLGLVLRLSVVRATDEIFLGPGNGLGIVCWA